MDIGGSPYSCLDNLGERDLLLAVSGGQEGEGRAGRLGVKGVGSGTGGSRGRHRGVDEGQEKGQQETDGG